MVASGHAQVPLPTEPPAEDEVEVPVDDVPPTGKGDFSKLNGLEGSPGSPVGCGAGRSGTDDEPLAPPAPLSAWALAWSERSRSSISNVTSSASMIPASTVDAYVHTASAATIMIADLAHVQLVAFATRICSKIPITEPGKRGPTSIRSPVGLRGLCAFWELIASNFGGEKVAVLKILSFRGLDGAKIPTPEPSGMARFAESSEKFAESSEKKAPICLSARTTRDACRLRLSSTGDNEILEIWRSAVIIGGDTTTASRLGDK